MSNLEETKDFLKKHCLQRCNHNSNESCICKVAICFKEIEKAQEQEKLIVELCEYCGMDNLYPYDNLNEIEIAFKDTFDNYQRQRIESLGRLNKQEKVLDVIKKKKVSIDLLYASSGVEQYNSELVRVYGLWFVKDRQLTQEEFDALKRWVG